MNCGRFKANDLESSNEFSSIDGLSVSEKKGQDLYKNNCQGCHHDLNSSSLLSLNENILTESFLSAIKNQASMKFLEDLSDEEKKQIVLAILGAQRRKPLTPEFFGFEIQPFVGSRFLVKSHFLEAFTIEGSTDGQDLKIQKIIENLIGSNAGAFAGSCSRYDDDCMTNTCGAFGDSNCVGQLEIKMNAGANFQNTLISASYLIRACEEILDVEKATTNLLVNSGLTIGAPLNEVSLAQVTQFIFHDKKVDEVFLKELVRNTLEAQTPDLVKKYNEKTLSDIERLGIWKMTLLPICSSSLAFSY